MHCWIVYTCGAFCFVYVYLMKILRVDEWMCEWLGGSMCEYVACEHGPMQVDVLYLHIAGCGCMHVCVRVCVYG